MRIKKLKHNQGITLVSLIITIILMLIISGVTISVLRNTNLFENTQITKEEYKKSAEKEALALAKTEITMRKEMKETIPLDLTTEIEKILNNAKQKVQSIQRIDDNNYLIIFKETTDVYKFNAETGEIQYLGKQGTEEQIRASQEAIAYSLKDEIKQIASESGENTDIASQIENKIESKGKEVTVTKDDDYPNKYIVLFNDSNDIYELDTTTGKMSYIGKYDPSTDNTELTQADIEFIYTPKGYTNGNVETEIQAGKIEGMADYTLQYSKDNSTWKAYTSKIKSTENETIYARIKNRTTGEIKAYGAQNILNIDKEKPTVSIKSENVKTNGFELKTTVTDEESGLGSITWYYKEQTASEYTVLGTKTYTEKNSSIKGEITQIEKNSTDAGTITDLTSGTYKAYATVTDVAGNSKNTEEIEIETGTVETASGASYTPTGWTNGNVTATLPTKTRYTTRYTTGNTTPTKDSTQYTAPLPITANTTINYIYTDGTNIGGAGTCNVTNIDKSLPTIGGSTGRTIVSGNSGTITFSSIADTGGSGLTGIYISTSNSKPSANASGWISNTAATYSKSYSPTSTTTYYAWAKDSAGNVSSSARSCTITVQAAIAKVGNTYYASVQSAITSTTSPTVTVLANSTESLSIASGKNVTLNMNGKTITYNGTVISNFGTCTINGSGTLTSTYAGSGCAINDYGTMRIRSITINSQMNGYIHLGNGSAYIKYCTFNITRAGTAVITGDSSGSKDTGKVYIRSTHWNVTNANYNFIYVRRDGCDVFEMLSTTSQGSFRFYAESGAHLVSAAIASDSITFWYRGSASGVNAQWPIWTPKDGQDEIDWLTCNPASWGSAATTWKSQHKNETGPYVMHYYVNGSFCTAWDVNPDGDPDFGLYMK